MQGIIKVKIPDRVKQIPAKYICFGMSLFCIFRLSNISFTTGAVVPHKMVQKSAITLFNMLLVKMYFLSVIIFISNLIG